MSPIRQALIELNTQIDRLTIMTAQNDIRLDAAMDQVREQKNLLARLQARRDALLTGLDVEFLADHQGKLDAVAGQAIGEIGGKADDARFAKPGTEGTHSPSPMAHGPSPSPMAHGPSPSPMAHGPAPLSDELSDDEFLSGDSNGRA